MIFNRKNIMYMVFNIVNMLIYLIVNNDDKISGIIFFIIVFVLYMMTIYMSNKESSVYKIFTEYGRYIALYELLIYAIVFIVGNRLGSASFVVFMFVMGKFVFYFIVGYQYERRLSLPKDKAQKNLIAGARWLSILFVGITVVVTNIKPQVSTVSLLLATFIALVVMYGSEHIWYTYLFNTRKEKLANI